MTGKDLGQRFESAAHQGDTNSNSIPPPRLARFIIHDPKSKQLDVNDPLMSPLHKYPPATRPNPPQRLITMSNSESISNYPSHPPYRPVPATTLFARTAYPLLLPTLDRYLSSLPPPVFPSTGRDSEGSIFPPLDKLENTGITLDDLENNTKIPPAWRDRTGILSTMVSSFISILVCTIQHTVFPSDNQPRVQARLHHSTAYKVSSTLYKYLHCF